MLYDTSELDRLTANMNELAVKNMIAIFNEYVMSRSITEIKTRIDTEEMNPMFEWKMRWIAELKQFFESLLKN